MRGSAISDQLNQRRSRAGTRPFGRPLRDGMDRQKVVAVDANARNTVAGAARRERALLAAGISLKSRDGPLIVHHVQNDRRLIHGGKQQRMMKIRLGAAAFSDPARRQMIFSLDGL